MWRLLSLSLSLFFPLSLSLPYPTWKSYPDPFSLFHKLCVYFKKRNAATYSISLCVPGQALGGAPFSLRVNALRTDTVCLCRGSHLKASDSWMWSQQRAWSTPERHHTAGAQLSKDSKTESNIELRSGLTVLPPHLLRTPHSPPAPVVCFVDSSRARAVRGSLVMAFIFVVVITGDPDHSLHPLAVCV